MGPIVLLLNLVPEKQDAWPPTDLKRDFFTAHLVFTVVMRRSPNTLIRL